MSQQTKHPQELRKLGDFLLDFPYTLNQNVSSLKLSHVFCSVFQLLKLVHAIWVQPLDLSLCKKEKNVSARRKNVPGNGKVPLLWGC